MACGNARRDSSGGQRRPKPLPSFSRRKRLSSGGFSASRRRKLPSRRSARRPDDRSFNSLSSAERRNSKPSSSAYAVKLSSLRAKQRQNLGVLHHAGRD